MAFKHLHFERKPFLCPTFLSIWWAKSMLSRSLESLPLKMQVFESHALGHSTLPLCCCCCSVAKLCLTLRNPMDGSTPGSSVLHCLPQFAQIHVYWVGDAIQPSHPLLPPSLFALNLSQHQGLFQWVRSFPMSRLFASGDHSIGASASVLPMNIQDWLPLELTGLTSLQFKGLSGVLSSTTIQKHQSFGTQLSL